MDEDVESVTLHRVNWLHRTGLVQRKVLHRGQIAETVGVEVGELRQIDNFGFHWARAVDGSRFSRLRLRARRSRGLVSFDLFLIVFLVYMIQAKAMFNA